MITMKTIRLGTRASKLALWQATHIKSLLTKVCPGNNYEIVPITTTGDISAITIDTKNVFVKEIEEALLNERVDIAVHSLKDMSSIRTEGLDIAAYLGGANRMDVLISKAGLKPAELPEEARIGTGSARRIAQIKLMRDDFKILPIRGNVDTRLAKLDNGEYDAIILAAAGLERLGLTGRVSHTFSTEEIVPSAGQGIIAIESRAKDKFILEKVKTINDSSAATAATIEFEFMRLLGADCNVPLGVFAQVIEDKINVSVFHCSGTNKCIRFNKDFDIKEADKIAKELAKEL